MKHEKLTKKTVFFVMVFLAVFLFTANFAAYRLRVKVTKECEEILETATKQNSKHFGVQFDHIVKTLKTTSQVLALNRGEITESELQFLETMRNNLEAVTCGVYLESGTCYLSTGVQIEISAPMFWEKIREGDSYIGRLQDRTVYNGDGIIVGVPLHHEGDEEPYGAVYAHFSVYPFADMVSQSIFGDKGYSFISDSKGNVLIPARQIISYADAGSIQVDGHDEELSRRLYRYIREGNQGLFPVRMHPASK